MSKYKEIYSYAYQYRGNNEDVLCLKIIYNIISYPEFIFILFDFHYSELNKFKDKIFKLIEGNLILNINAEYKLSGIIEALGYNHYNTIEFNPIDITINSNFSVNNIYYHDGTLNNGKIISITEKMDLKSLGNPYIVIYKKFNS